MFYYKKISEKILGASFEVYNYLGNGYLEKNYENALLYEIRQRELSADNQHKLIVNYKDIVVGEYFADIMVEDKIILELKVCNNLSNIHKAQLINYLKTTGYKVGYLLNFGQKNKLEYKRFVL